MNSRLVPTTLVLLFVLASAECLAAAAEPPVFKRWESDYRHIPPTGGDSSDWALTVRETSDGGYLAGGFAHGSCGHRVPSLFKMDVHGAVQWHFVYDAGAPCGFGSFGEVLEVEDGYVAFGRKSIPGHGNRMLFVKVDRRGQVLVQRVLNGIRPPADLTSESGGRAARRTQDGGFIVSGHMRVVPGEDDLLLVKLDLSGEIEWARNYSLCIGGREDANAVTPVRHPVTGAEVGFVLAGESCGNLVVARVEPDGDLLWTVAIDSGGPPGEVRASMSGGPGKPFPYVQESITKGPCPPGAPTHWDLAQSIEQSQDLEHLIVGGHFNRHEVDGGAGQDACPALNDAHDILTPEYLEGDGVLLRLDLDGRIELLRNVAHCSGLDFATRARETVAPEAPGYVFSCTTADAGVVSAEDPTNMLLVKTDLVGNREWHRAFKGPGTGACAFDMAVTRDGGYVFAGNNLDNQDDYALVRLTSGCQAHTPADVENQTVPAGAAETWSTSRTVKGTVRVAPGARLTIEGSGTRIEFFDTRQINDFDAVSRRAGVVVEPGGHLEIRQATLGGLDACNGIWEGVRVLGDPARPQLPFRDQGRLVALDGATIRDAVVGIHVGGTTYDAEGGLSPTFTHGGGIVQMSRARLLNNRKGVAFFPYESPVPRPGGSPSSFSDVTFESDAFMRDTAYVTPDGRRLAANEHLSMFGVRGVRISGSTFRNSIPPAALGADIRGTGIAAFDATFEVDAGCRRIAFSPFPRCVERQPTEFEGLTAGIVTGTTRFDRRMSVSGSRFASVQQGITSVGQYFDSVADSSFELPAGVAMPVHGVLMDAASGFSLRRNTLTAELPLANEGVVLRDTGSLPSRIQDNTFSSIATGIRTLGANPKVDIFCNTFEGNPAGALVVGSGHLKPQGEACGDGALRADNTFLSPGLTHLYGFGDQSLVYRHSAGPVEAFGDVTVECLGDPEPSRCPRPSGCDPICAIVLASGAEAVTESAGRAEEVGADATLHRVRRLLEARRTDQALRELARLETSAAFELRVELHLEGGDLGAARRLLEERPPRSAPEEAFQRFFAMKLRLAEEEREVWELTEGEVAVLRDLEATPGRVGWLASRWLLAIGRRENRSAG